MLAIEFTKVQAAVCTQGIFCCASKYKEYLYCDSTQISKITDKKRSIRKKKKKEEYQENAAESYQPIPIQNPLYNYFPKP